MLRRARRVQRRDFVGAERERGRADQAFELRQRGRARDWRGDARALNQPGERDFRGRGFMTRGDFVERSEDAGSARIQVRLDGAAARALPEIGLAAIFAAQEPFGEAEIGDDADLLAYAEIAQ